MVFGFATALIFEFLGILVRERREDLARKNYKPAASFPRSMWQLSAGWPEDTVRKNFPVLKTIHPIRKKQDAQKLVLIGTEVNASFAADSFLHSHKLFFPLPLSRIQVSCVPTLVIHRRHHLASVGAAVKMPWRRRVGRDDGRQCLAF